MENASSSMWEHLHDGLRAFIAKRVGNEAEIEDLLQEVFLRVHQNAQDLQEPERMVSWVYQITRNAIVDQLPISAAATGMPSRSRHRD